MGLAFALQGLKLETIQAAFPKMWSQDTPSLDYREGGLVKMQLPRLESKGNGPGLRILLSALIGDGPLNPDTGKLCGSFMAFLV